MADDQEHPFKKVWSDPVGSKVIATVVVALAVAIWARLSSDRGPALVGAHEHVAYWIIVALLVSFILTSGLFFWSRRDRRGTINRTVNPEARVALLTTSVSQADAAKNLRYPIKIHAEFRNESSFCADVSIASYAPELVPLEKLVPEVFQIRAGDDWLPSVDGIDRVAVLPGHRFRIWLGVDKARFADAGQVRHLLGHAGTITLAVNGTDCDFAL